ncbi:hypothetical protein GQ55_1G315200 [Panicum hallii var. hallii]|uniref:Uncharacterized protein n=1 Tax=Panicum hallii var. hallii TaxID=1504633 RepID=A0A2T7F9I4_9POAL|nr:hypothetical protein GQ55_1G315200 [Panicum hallii var. hallii]
MARGAGSRIVRAESEVRAGSSHRGRAGTDDRGPCPGYFCHQACRRPRALMVCRKGRGGAVANCLCRISGKHV